MLVKLGTGAAALGPRATVRPVTRRDLSIGERPLQPAVLDKGDDSRTPSWPPGQLPWGRRAFADRGGFRSLSLTLGSLGNSI